MGLLWFAKWMSMNINEPYAVVNPNPLSLILEQRLVKQGTISPRFHPILDNSSSEAISNGLPTAGFYSFPVGKLSVKRSLISMPFQESSGAGVKAQAVGLRSEGLQIILVSAWFFFFIADHRVWSTSICGSNQRTHIYNCIYIYYV